MDNDNVFKIGAWSKGINNIDRVDSIAPDELREASNVDIDRYGKVSRRTGYSQIVAGTGARSIWSNGKILLYADGTDLIRIHPEQNNATTVLDSRFTPGESVCYLDVNGDVYYSDGLVTGKLNQNSGLSTWGVEQPSGQPLVVPSATGGLDEGVYQVVVTYISDTGEESGTSGGIKATVPAGGGISLMSIPQPVSNNVTHVGIYATKANGDTFYLYETIAVGVTSRTISATSTWGRTLETQFMSKMPPAELLAFYNGRIYSAKGNIVTFSEPLRYGLYKPSRNIFVYPSEVTVIAPVADGIFIVADRTYFLQGGDPSVMQQVEKLEYGAIKGSSLVLPVSATGTDEPVVAWWSSKGLVYGRNGGSVENVMEKRVAVDEYVNGALLYREEDGIRQILSLMNEKPSDNSLKVSDRATAEIRRNGITIT